MSTDLLFIVFGIFAIAMAAGVVFAKNAVHSAFCLILTFFAMAGLFVLWGNSFLGMLQILIYTGAIVVLFVFVVMLLGIDPRPHAIGSRWWLGAVGGAASWIVGLLLLRTLNGAFFFSGRPAHPFATDMRTISKLLFTDYLWPFEVLSLFLLALILGIFVLARPENEQEKRGS